MRRLLFLLPALYIALYFFHNAHWGLRADFTQDDLMNMYRSLEFSYQTHLRECLVFWRPSIVYRPFGSLVYKVSLDLFGLDLRALSVLRYLALCLNLALVYFLTRRLSGSRETGALAALLLAYHQAFSPLYFDSGMLYDIFCFSFYFAGFLYYVRVRQSGRLLGPLEIAVFFLLFVAGLDTKEMGVTLPVMLGFYELLYHPPQSFAPKSLAGWLRRAAPVPVAGALVSAAFSLGRVMAKEGLAGIGGYKTTFTVAQYIEYIGRTLASLVYRLELTPAAWVPALFLASLVALTLVFRSRALGLAALLYAVGSLPVAFIRWRGLASAYVPLAGLAMFGAALLVAARNLLTQRWSAKVLLFAAVASVLWRVHPDTVTDYDAWRKQEYEPIRSVMTQLQQLHPKINRTDRVLIVKDPFGEFRWASLFIVRLVCRQPDVIVDRLESMERKPTAEEIARYDMRLAFENGKLREVPPSDVPALF